MQFHFENLISTFEIGILHALLKAFDPHSKTELVMFSPQDIVVKSQLSTYMELLVGQQICEIPSYSYK